MPSGTSDRDPRNWPTLTRLVADRYEVAGRVMTLRVFARPTEYFNCSYRGTQGRLKAFTLMGGPLETVTGYMPAELGGILERFLELDPWTPITVQVRFDPARLSETCPEQVDIIKFARGWQYPPGSVTPGRPNPGLQATREMIKGYDERDLWRSLTGRGSKNKPTQMLHVGDRVQLTAGSRLSAAYHCVFKGSARTHYALQLHDGAGHFVHGYVPKTRASRELVDYVALHRDVLLTVQAKVVKQTMSHYCDNQLEISGWELPRPKPSSE